MTSRRVGKCKFLFPAGPDFRTLDPPPELSPLAPLLRRGDADRHRHGGGARKLPHLAHHGDQPKLPDRAAPDVHQVHQRAAAGNKSLAEEDVRRCDAGYAGLLEPRGVAAPALLCGLPAHRRPGKATI